MEHNRIALIASLDTKLQETLYANMRLNHVEARDS